jgi:O-antigen/teichoic acid export membrane protein
MLAIATLETFSQTGFQAALIQKKENVESYLDTAWTVSAIRGVVLFLILFLSAPVVAKFFNSPQATLVIKIIAVSTLLSGFRNIGILFFQKELEFNKQFFYELSATLVDVTVAITLAFMLRNVWALVWGGLAANFIRLFMSYILHPYRPHTRFDKGEFKELFGFGRWVLGSSILVFLLTHGDDIFVGKMLGVTALGFYQMAYMLSNLPATEISHVISQVTFPAYSKLQDDLLTLKEAYLKTLQFTAFISIPLAGGIFILSPEFTRIFLGEKWMPIVPAMQVLALFGMLRAIGATTGVVFLAAGKPEIRTKVQSAQLILLAILIYPLTMRWGIMGTSMAVTAYALIFNLVAVYNVLNIVKSGCKKPARLLIFPLIGTSITILAIFALKTYILDHVGFAYFLLLVVVGIFVYFLITHLFDRFLNYGSKQLIQEQFIVLFQKSKGT